MRLTRILFFLVLLLPVYTEAQGIPRDSICCSLSRENEAEQTLKKMLGPFKFFIGTGNYTGCETILAKAGKMQTDSFECCITSQYLILDAATILAFAKKEYRELIPLTSAILKLIDSTEIRYRRVSKATDFQKFSLVRLITLQKRYIAYVHTLSIDELDRLGAAIDSIRPRLNGQLSDYELPYLLARAQYFQSFKNYRESRRNIEDVFRLKSDQDDNLLLLTAAYNQMALLYFDEGADRKAVMYCDSGLAILDKAPVNHPFYFILKLLKVPVLINKGIALTKLGELNKADTVFAAAMVFFKRFKDSTGLTGPRILHNHGTCELFMGKYDSAYSRIKTANELYTKYLFRYFGGLHEDDKYQLMEIVDEAFNAMPVLLTKAPDSERERIIRQIYNEQLTIKGLVFKSQRLIRAALREGKDSAIVSLYNKMNSASEKLLRGMQQSNLWSAKDVIELERIRRDCEEELYRKSAIFRKVSDQLHVNAGQVQRSLKKGETAIELIQYKEIDWAKRSWNGEKRYAAIIINYNDSAVRYVPLCLESDIERLFDKAGAGKGNSNGVSRLCYQPLKESKGNLHLDDSLARYILKPLLPYLKGTSVIYISPVGLLSRIPFHALSYLRKGPLIDYFDIRNLLTTGSLVNREEEETVLPATASLWYNIDYGRPVFSYPVNKSGWLGTIKSKLPISWDHLRGNLLMPSLKKWFTDLGIKYYKYEKKKAGEHAFKQLDPLKAEILHIETHGFSVAVKPVEFAPLKQDYDLWQARNPLFFSGLFLAGSKYTWQGFRVADNAENDILTAYEVAQMDFRKSKLVVLGACETGLGQIKGNEGVYGLGRAFKMAGADKIIISLWNIPDKHSQEMFRLFYKYWLKDKMPVQKAFREAQRGVYKKYRQPFFWSGFIMVE